MDTDTFTPTRCPLWCEEDHSLQLHAEDRWHRGGARELPAVLLDLGGLAVGRPPRVFGAEVHALLIQQIPGGAVFVEFGTDSRGDCLRLTLESAERFSVALAAVIHTVQAQ